MTAEEQEAFDMLADRLRFYHEWLWDVRRGISKVNGLDHAIGANPDCSGCSALARAAAIRPRAAHEDARE